MKFLVGDIIDKVYSKVYKKIYMGKPLMIREEDDDRLEGLKKAVRAKTKVQVLREALSALEQNLERRKRVQRWKRAAALVSKESDRVNREFRAHSRLKSLED